MPHIIVHTSLWGGAQHMNCHPGNFLTEIWYLWAHAVCAFLWEIACGENTTWPSYWYLLIDTNKIVIWKHKFLFFVFFIHLKNGLEIHLNDLHVQWKFPQVIVLLVLYSDSALLIGFLMWNYEFVLCLLVFDHYQLLQTSFDAPEGSHAIALDLGSMEKGQAWVNGRGIGRFWSLVAPKTGCPQSCNYRGAYNEDKCTTNCGEPTQTWYRYPPAITYLIW